MARTLMILAALRAGSVVATSQIQTRGSLSDYGLTRESLARVEIIYYPERILTRSSLTPEILKTLYK